MRHRIKGRKLGRTSASRKSLLRNLSLSLIKEEAIVTTLPKAKELRSYFDTLVTLAKIGDLAKRRILFSKLRDSLAVTKIIDVIAQRSRLRSGGYVSVLKKGFRLGDNAPMALVTLMDRSE